MASQKPDPIASLPGSLTHADARSAGLSDRALRTLVDRSVLTRLGRGVYRRADAPPADEDLLEIALRAPAATLCLVTGLAHHDQTDQIPDRIDVALPRSQRPPRVSARVRWHRFDETTYAIGRDELIVDEEVRIGLYSPERCIVDAFRLRHQVGEELAIEALRRWLRRNGSVPATLLEMARAFPKAEPSLRAALRVLL